MDKRRYLPLSPRSKETPQMRPEQKAKDIARDGYELRSHEPFGRKNTNKYLYGRDGVVAPSSRCESDVYGPSYED